MHADFGPTTPPDTLTARESSFPLDSGGPHLPPVYQLAPPPPPEERPPPDERLLLEDRLRDDDDELLVEDDE